MRSIKNINYKALVIKNTSCIQNKGNNITVFHNILSSWYLELCQIVRTLIENFREIKNWEIEIWSLILLYTGSSCYVVSERATTTTGYNYSYHDCDENEKSLSDPKVYHLNSSLLRTSFFAKAQYDSEESFFTLTNYLQNNCVPPHYFEAFEEGSIHIRIRNHCRFDILLLCVYVCVCVCVCVCVRVCVCVCVHLYEPTSGDNFVILTA